MNERIKELAKQAEEYADIEYNASDLDWYELKEEKFAELIVRECAEITDGLSKLYPRTDVAFDVGYTMGTSRATKEIKQHFGVEE
jgi:arginyl-tRNA synthetase